VEALTREGGRFRAEVAAGRPRRGRVALAAPVWLRRLVADVAATPVIALLALLGVGIVLFATTRDGPGISPDSVNYIGAARDLLADGDLRNIQHGTEAGGTFVLWPPLFPVLIALVSLGPGDYAEAARLVNATAFGLAVLVAGLWLRRTGVGRPWVVLGCLAALLSYPLLRVSVYAWSEPTFALWLLLFAVALGRYLEAGGRRSLLAAAGCAAAAWLTRYVGASVVLAGPLFVALRWRRHRRRALRDASLFFAVAATPGALWLLRNELVTSTLAGPRVGSTRGVGTNTWDALATAGDWFRPGWMPGSWSPWLALGGLLATAGLVGVLAQRNPSVRQLVTRPDVVAMAVMVGAYLAYLIASASVVAVDPIGTRFLAPVAVPLGLLLIVAVAALARALADRRAAAVGHAALVAAAFAWLLVPAAGADRLVTQAHARGAGQYATDRWRDSPLLAYVRTGRLAGRLVSNHPEAIAFYTDRSVSSVPGAGNERSLAAFVASVGTTPTYVVWFTIGGERTGRVSLPDLRRVVALRPVATGRDGKIYLATPK
jgi:4-amino-4-deoxy-L-arabinose transferase-like glycosyltransferase